jgi:uncharacterized Zn finger protein
MRKKIDYRGTFKCPDCGRSSFGHELLYNIPQHPTLLVCPKCGVIQNKKEVERQLRKVG